MYIVQTFNVRNFCPPLISKNLVENMNVLQSTLSKFTNIKHFSILIIKIQQQQWWQQQHQQQQQQQKLIDKVFKEFPQVQIMSETGTNGVGISRHLLQLSFPTNQGETTYFMSNIPPEPLQRMVPIMEKYIQRFILAVHKECCRNNPFKFIINVEFIKDHDESKEQKK